MVSVARKVKQGCQVVGEADSGEELKHSCKYIKMAEQNEMV